jgi:hypothetical protein
MIDITNIDDLKMNWLARQIVNGPTVQPYFHLDGYMDRWWVTPDPKLDSEQSISARLHRILRADADDVMHDHPFDTVTLILAGGYVELVPEDPAQDPEHDALHFVSHLRRPGDVIYRKATDRHRIIAVAPAPFESWSLFCCGPWKQDWGFYAPTGKVYWREYLNQWGADPEPGEVATAR